MDIFDQHDTDRNALEKICDEENNHNLLAIVSMVSMINKKFYSPVAFLIEYISNKNLQKMVEQVTGYAYYGFIVMYLKNFPNVAKSRKLKRIVEDAK
jgi:hypothetical protein